VQLGSYLVSEDEHGGSGQGCQPAQAEQQVGVLFESGHSVGKLHGEIPRRMKCQWLPARCWLADS
jgi:hypothetical protein